MTDFLQQRAFVFLKFLIHKLCNLLGKYKDVDLTITVTGVESVNLMFSSRHSISVIIN